MFDNHNKQCVKNNERCEIDGMSAQCSGMKKNLAMLLIAHLGLLIQHKKINTFRVNFNCY